LNKSAIAKLKWQSATPCSHEFDDAYFSLKNGIEESNYVFLKGNNLPTNWQSCSQFVIAETGFGTGLNFLNTARLWHLNKTANQTLVYFSIEKYPISLSDLTKIHSDWPQFEVYSQRLLQNYPENIPGMHTISFPKCNLHLCLLIGDINEMLLEISYPVDAWYFDGFSPAKNPDMWSESVFRNIANLSHKETTFSTFTAASLVQKNLKLAGFRVNKIKGFGKKREMLCGTFDKKDVNHQNSNPWFTLPKNQKNKNDSIAIIGGGLAGLSCAWFLKKKNMSSVVFESSHNVAADASGNPAGIVLPKIDLDLNWASLFYIQSFLITVQCLEELKENHPELGWHQSGVLVLMNNDKLKRFAQLNLPNSIMLCVDKSHAQELAGIEVNSGGLFFPKAGYVNPKQLVTIIGKELGQSNSVKCGQLIQSIEYENSLWRIRNDDKEIETANSVIFCNSHQINSILKSKSVNVKKSRGQLSFYHENEMSKQLKMPICDNGYLIPSVKGLHCVGATYGDSDNESLDKKDHMTNIENIRNSVNCFENSDTEQLLGRVSFRGTTEDRMPVVGPIFDEMKFQEDYSDLHHGRIDKHYPAASYLPGLYASVGHGSRGLVSCFSSAQYLTGLLCGDASMLPKSAISRLHPGRFLIKALKKGLI